MTAPYDLLTQFADATATEVRHAACPCPHCAVMMELAHGPKDGPPAHPGDFCVCIKCAGGSRYDEAMRLYAVTEADLAALPAEYRAQFEELQSLVRYVKMREQRGDGLVRA